MSKRFAATVRQYLSSGALNSAISSKPKGVTPYVCCACLLCTRLCSNCCCLLCNCLLCRCCLLCSCCLLSTVSGCSCCLLYTHLSIECRYFLCSYLQRRAVVSGLMGVLWTAGLYPISRFVTSLTKVVQIHHKISIVRVFCTRDIHCTWRNKIRPL